ncbi:LIM domain-binding protein 3-like isoform X1 [Watersipora subatra]|uniref:LIM domain-binding protein 3-like isoform X1 n=1 Tax=Watersipora subatra TaxID=2589382 RepID=UPI00355B8A58
MEYSIKLHRDSLASPWGFRMQGGANLNSALTIQRVFSGSPSEGELQQGDIIVSIDNRDATNFSHAAAEQAIKSAGGELSLRIKRTGPNHSLPHTTFTDQQNQQNMYNQSGGYDKQYTHGYYNSPNPGSKISPQDQAMLQLVSHSLGTKQLHQSNVPGQPMGYYNEPNNQQHYGWVPSQNSSGQPGKTFYQPHNFNRPTPGPLSYKPSRNPYSSTASAAHLQYNSPLALYSKKNAQNALNSAVPGDSSAAQTIKAQRKGGVVSANKGYAPTDINKPRLSAYEGGEAKGDIVDSPTLRYVLREDQVKAKTGHNADMRFYKEVHEYGPGMVPLKAYKEEVDDVVPTSDF